VHNFKDKNHRPISWIYGIYPSSFTSSYTFIGQNFPVGNYTVKLYIGIIHLLLSRTENLHRTFHLSESMTPSNVPECLRTHQHCYSYNTFQGNIGKPGKTGCSYSFTLEMWNKLFSFYSVIF
jgi:hypothetical protein